jgi:hypothetical protein
MTTEAEANAKTRRTIEEIIQQFQPIEHFFDVMGAADSGIQGVFVRRWAEIGVSLATAYRECLDRIAAASKDRN